MRVRRKNVYCRSPTQTANIGEQYAPLSYCLLGHLTDCPFRHRKVYPVPELIRSAVSRARMYFKDRRRSPRLNVRLAFSLSVIRQTKLKRVNGNDRTLKGHTLDISANGLALLLPQIQLDGYHLASEDREMQLVLELSGGVVSMVVVPNRYEKLERAELGCNYLIGARIIRMDEADRVRYQDFMRHNLEHGRKNDESDAN